ncbi:MAG: hypothetical protein ABEL51_15895 [Salinibacter sp.]
MNEPARWRMMGLTLLAASLLTGCSLLGSGPDGAVPLCQDENVRDYARMMHGHTELTREATARLGELMPQLREENALIMVPDWRGAVGDQLTPIIHASKQVGLMRAPRPDLRPAHKRFRRAYALYQRGAQAIHEGLTRHDAPTALEGYRLLRGGRVPFEAARDDLAEMLGPCVWYSSRITGNGLRERALGPTQRRSLR